MQLTPEVLYGFSIGMIGAIMYAFSVVVYRSQKDEIKPLTISAMKMWIALPVMTLLVFLPLVPSPFIVPFETVIILALSIILGAVIGDTIYLISQERIGVSHAFPIAMSFPILTYALTIIFLGEALIASRLVGVFIAVIGVIVISREQESEDTQEKHATKFDAIGIFLAILTSILYALGTVILQVGVTDVDPITANFIRVMSGSIAFAPMFVVARFKGMPLPTKRATKLVALAAFFGMGIGSLFYVIGVKYAGATIMSVIGATAPLFAVPVSVIFLKERVTRLAGIGILITIIGVILVVTGF
ncbi:MAG: DMT family transporter [Candidatus Thorarchaeota archaeon]